MARNVAADAYESRQRRIKELIEQIGASLSSHEKRHLEDSKNWGLVGDLAHVEAQLQEVADFIE